MIKLFTRILVCAAVAALLLSGLAVNADTPDPLVELRNPGEIITVPSDDLFQNFKDLMPGMKVDQPIAVKNTFSKTVSMYLEVKAADSNADENAAGSKKLLDALDLKLALKQPNGQISEIFNKKASGTTEGQRIFLGTYAPNSSGDITATVTVPAELGNDYQSLAGKTIWIFSCEEVVYSSSSTGTTSIIYDANQYIPTATIFNMPETGGFPMLALVPMGVALVLGGLFLGRKKKQ